MRTKVFALGGRTSTANCTCGLFLVRASQSCVHSGDTLGRRSRTLSDRFQRTSLAHCADLPHAPTEELWSRGVNAAAASQIQASLQRGLCALGARVACAVAASAGQVPSGRMQSQRWQR